MKKKVALFCAVVLLAGMAGTASADVIHHGSKGAFFSLLSGDHDFSNLLQDNWLDRDDGHDYDFKKDNDGTEFKWWPFDKAAYNCDKDQSDNNAPVPEPATMFLVGAGLGFVSLRRRADK